MLGGIGCYFRNRALVDLVSELVSVRGRIVRDFQKRTPNQDKNSQAQQFLGFHVAIGNLFNLDRHLVRAEHYRDLRVCARNEWSRVAV